MKLKLKQKIPKWVEEKIISPEQGQQILLYEENQRSASWIGAAFLYLGAFTFSLGVISLIASNWDQISVAAKLGADFLLLTLCAGLLYFFSTREVVLSASNKIRFEVGLFIYLLLILASIGLSAQIFHTQGEFYEAIFFWSMATVFLTTFSTWISTHFLWTVFFLGSVLAFGLDKKLIEKDQLVVFFPMSCLLIAALLEWGKRSRGKVVSFRLLGFWSAVGMLFYLDVFRLFTGFLKIPWQNLFFPVIVPVVFLTGSNLFFIMNHPHYTRFQKKCLAVALLCLGYYTLPPQVHFPLPYEHMIFGIVIYTSCALFFAVSDRRKDFYFFVGLVAFKILGFYFMLMESLLNTGVGLMFSGAVMMGVVALIYRQRVYFQKWIDEIKSEK